MRINAFLYFLTLISFCTTASAQLEKKSSPAYYDNRDQNSYELIILYDLQLFAENQRYQTPNSMTVIDSSSSDTAICGEFYLVDEAFNVCPEGWRLPTEKEVKSLIKAWRKGRVDLLDTLQIKLCGRIDNENLSRIGEQNTFWIDSELKDGSITHWHVFGSDIKMHNHNVVVARRRFPVRCVCEVQK
jgi:hypothetical protein